MKERLFFSFFLLFAFFYGQVTSNASQENYSAPPILLEKKKKKKKVNYSSRQIQFKKDTIHLVGNAKVTSEEYILKANKIVLSDEKNVVTAITKVSIVNTNDSSEYNGEYIRMFVKEKEIYGRRKCKIEEIDNLILCDKFYANDKEQFSYLTNDISIYQDKDTKDEILLKSQWGKYENDREFLFLKEECSSISKDLFSSAEQMKLKKDEFIIWYGNSKLYELKERKKKTKTNTIIYADYSKYFIYSNNNEEEYFLCISNVTIENLEDESTLSGEYVKYFPDKDVAYVKGDPVYTDTPNDVIVYANEFEKRKEDKKSILYAKGNVKMVSKNNQIKSTIAKFNIKENKIYMYGNAEITQGEDIYYCNLVEFNTKTEEMQMYGNIQGVIRN